MFRNFSNREKALLVPRGSLKLWGISTVTQNLTSDEIRPDCKGRRGGPSQISSMFDHPFIDGFSIINIYIHL